MGEKLGVGGSDFFELPTNIQRKVLRRLNPGERRMIRKYFYDGNNWDPNKAGEFGELLARIRREGNRRLKTPLPAYIPFESQGMDIEEPPVADVVVEEPVVKEPVVEKQVPPVKPSVPKENKRNQDSVVLDKSDVPPMSWNRDDFSRFLIEAAGGQKVGFDDFPARIAPGRIWSEVIGSVGVEKNFRQWKRVLIVADKDGQVRFSNGVPMDKTPMGFNSSLVQDDFSGRYKLNVLGEVRGQKPDLSNGYYQMPVRPGTLYLFLTDSPDLQFMVTKVDRRVYWLFASQETKAKKHGNFKDGYENFRDRWLRVAGLVRQTIWERIFHDDGIPWSNRDRDILNKTCAKICEHYKIVFYRQIGNGVLIREN